MMKNSEIPTNWFNKQKGHMNRIMDILDMNADLIKREDLSEHEIKYSFTYKTIEYCCYIHTKYISVVYRISPNFPMSENNFFKFFNEHFDIVIPNNNRIVL